MVVVSTIGYELADLNDFIATLLVAKIDVLIDVRELPLSRRKGFSKSAISEALTEAGIDYLHVKSLGDPKPGRDAAKSGQYNEFKKIYTNHIKSTEAQIGLMQTVNLAKSESICLMCYERNPSACHRKIITDYISSVFDCKIRHLDVKEGFAKSFHASKRSNINTRKSAATP